MKATNSKDLREHLQQLGVVEGVSPTGDHILHVEQQERLDGERAEEHVSDGERACDRRAGDRGRAAKDAVAEDGDHRAVDGVARSVLHRHRDAAAAEERDRRRDVLAAAHDLGGGPPAVSVGVARLDRVLADADQRELIRSVARERRTDRRLSP